MTILTRGTQIVYVPQHVLEQLEIPYPNRDCLQHKDVEYGFVTSGPGVSRDDPFLYYYCRYWRQGTYNTLLKDDWEECLRTKANSEATPSNSILVVRYTRHKVIQAALDKYC